MSSACRTSLFFLLAVLGSFLLSFDKVECLSCPLCDDNYKEEVCPKDLRCRYGVTTDMCGCCPDCYRGLGEKCGGIWDQGGYCAEHLGLTCPKWTIDNQDPQTCVYKTQQAI